MGACSRTLQWEHALLLGRCESPLESEQSEQAIPSNLCVQFHYLDLQYNICGQRHWHPIPRWWTWWSRCPKPSFSDETEKVVVIFFRKLRCERSGHWAMTLVDQLIIELRKRIISSLRLGLCNCWSKWVANIVRSDTKWLSDTNCTTSVWSTLTQSSISCEIENVWKHVAEAKTLNILQNHSKSEVSWGYNGPSADETTFLGSCFRATNLSPSITLVAKAVPGAMRWSTPVPLAAVGRQPCNSWAMQVEWMYRCCHVSNSRLNTPFQRRKTEKRI